MTIEESIYIEKLVFGGQGLGRLANGQAVFVWNALPGEDVRIRIIKKKKNYIEAIATEIVTASPERVAPVTPHFLSTSAWEILSPASENEHKVLIAQETYKKIGNFALPDLDIYSSDKQFGYRNKIEFSFCDRNFVPKKDRRDDHVEEVSLAFYERGGKNRIPVTGSALATESINAAAEYLFDWIAAENIPNRSLKSLVIRSNRKGETIAAFFVKDEWNFSCFPELREGLVGLQVYYSSYQTPASRPDKLLYSVGQDYLMERLLNCDLKFGALSFFQVNPPVFEQTLRDIGEYLQADMDIVDFYAGVGAIGLPLFEKYNGSVLVDSNEEAINYAKENIAMNKVTNVEAHCTPSEQMLEVIASDKIIIVDPPRAGMHVDVVNKLIEKKPKRIVYLSCNLSTQARDVAMLLPHYRISFSRLYNYFPRTPHMEGLLILERI